MNLAIIPGYHEAVAKERFERTAAFAPLLETVCGVKVLPLTFGHLAILETVGSPFVSGGKITILDVGAFLWIVSPDFIPAGSWRAARARKRFLRQLGRMKFPAPNPVPERFNPALWTLQQAATQISDYIASAEVDLPGAPARPSVSSYSSLAGVVDVLASEYGWSEAQILKIPIRRVLQYINRIRDRQGDTCMFNPSDKIRQQWLDAHQPARN